MKFQRKPPVRAAFNRHMTVNTAPFARTLADLDLSGLTILEFGVGGGAITRLILERNPVKVIGYELESEIVPAALRADSRLDLRIMDFTTEDFSFLKGKSFAVICNPPYDLLPFIRDVIDRYAPTGTLLLSGAGKSRHFPDFEVAAAQPGWDFAPPAEGDHLLLLKGFKDRRTGPAAQGRTFCP